MSMKYDAVVIGAGLLGCFAARELTRFDLKTALMEKREDICTGISKATTAIVYSGCDHKPGTLKSRLTLRSNAAFGELCESLQVPFVRCGSLMVSFGEAGDASLRKKLENGNRIGVPGLKLLSGAEAREMEEELSPNVRSALYEPTAGTVDPWELCYAAFENAVANGCGYLPDTGLLSVRRSGKKYVLETSRGEIETSVVINCAGLAADKVHEMLFEPSVRIFPDSGDYLVLERGSMKLRRVIRHETEKSGKGLTAVPTTGGSILLGPTRRESEDDPAAVSPAGLAEIRTLAEEVFPGAVGENVIRSFAAVRPNPRSVVFRNGEYVPDGKSIGGFVIERPEPGFMSFIGIKTPGLTCASQLGALAANAAAEYLGAKKRTDFSGERKAIVKVRDKEIEGRAALVSSDRDYGEILCLCEQISRAEAIEAIRRGAVTVDGVKRRCGAMLGACQGSRCQREIAELLSQMRGIPTEKVTAFGGASYLTGGRHG